MKRHRFASASLVAVIVAIEQLHAHAFKAAEAAECTCQQGKFWEMHAQLFSHQQALGDGDLRSSNARVSAGRSKNQTRRPRFSTNSRNRSAPTLWGASMSCAWSGSRDVRI